MPSIVTRTASINDGGTPLSDAAEPLLMVSFEEQEVERLSAKRTRERAAAAGCWRQTWRPDTYANVPTRTDVCAHVTSACSQSAVLGCFVGATAVLRSHAAVLIAFAGAVILLQSVGMLTAINVTVRARWGTRIRLCAPSFTQRSIMYTALASIAAAVSIAAGIMVAVLLPLHIVVLMMGCIIAVNAVPSIRQWTLATGVRLCFMSAFLIAALPYGFAPLTLNANVESTLCTCSNAALLPNMPAAHTFMVSAAAAACDATDGCDCAANCATAGLHVALGCVAAAVAIVMHVLSTAALSRAITHAASYSLSSAFIKHRTSVRQRATTRVHGGAAQERTTVHSDAHVSAVEDTQTLVHPPTLRAYTQACTGAMLTVAGLGVALVMNSASDSSDSVASATTSIGTGVGALLLVSAAVCACSRSGARLRPLPATIAAPQASSSGFAPAYETDATSGVDLEPIPPPPPPVRARAAARITAASPVIPTRPWQRAETAVTRLEADTAAAPTCLRVMTRLCAHACAAICGYASAPLAACTCVAVIVTYATSQSCVAPLTCNSLLLTDVVALVLVWGAHGCCVYMHLLQRVWSRLLGGAAPPAWDDPLVLTHARTVGGLPRAAFEKDDDTTPLDAPTAGLPGTTKQNDV